MIFSNLFRRKISPTAADLYTISHTYLTPLQAEGFDFFQTLDEDTAVSQRKCEQRKVCRVIFIWPLILPKYLYADFTPVLFHTK